MLFQETSLPGCFVIHLETFDDPRGFFARTFCRREFTSRGLVPDVAQCNISFNHRAGTVRGMHYQVHPAEETKLVRCIRGAIYDVVVDMRPESPAYGRHVGVELSADNRRALYVPAMFAHGYQALVDGAEVLYQVSHPYSPEHEVGVRHDDPALGIAWPLPVTEVSDKDTSWPLLVRDGMLT